MYCKVLVDIAHANVDRLFTYAFSEGTAVVPGAHVLVPFGSGNRVKEGFVLSVSEQNDAGVPVKDVLRVLEPFPVLLPDQIELAHWLKSSYDCLLVDALRLMIPPTLRGQRAHEKVERTVAVAPGRDGNELLASLLDKSGKKRAAKQYEVLELLLSTGLTMSVSDVSACVPNAGPAIRALIERGYLVESGYVTFRTPMAGAVAPDREVTPTGAQLAAVKAVSDAMAEKRTETFLLHGVTGSGKTEVYMRCIRACLDNGKSAILLVPEISLTPQTVALFRARFGDEIAVLHSKLSDGERYDEWRRIRLGRARVAVGARSAIFAPMPGIGLIVVDEEHETSYQSEISPRYHAVDVAAKRASLASAPLLLGSATPQLLSYYRATTGRYRLLRLPDRVQKRPLPSVEIVDMREEFLSGNNGIFSARLTELLSECFTKSQQAMLFLNRRGYSTFVSCRACGAVVECENCDLSMTYHKLEDRMECHFCGNSKNVPRVCPSCKKPFIKYFGIGTEQVEEQAKKLFPGVNALRMDTDTVRGKNDAQTILASFASGEAQLLIGTQMIAKGLDFPNVTLVGVVAADSMLRFPDYRSTERTFQLLTQVAGRAGRDSSPGRVVIQTYSPNHPAIRFAKSHDYEGFFRYELLERQKALFPPFSLYLRVLFTGPDEQQVFASGESCGTALEAEIRALLGKDADRDLLLISASPAPVRRKNRDYRYQVLVKLLRTENTARVIRFVYEFMRERRNETFACVEINPQDML